MPATTAVDDLHDELRASILSGRLAPGTPLREEAISAQSGLGRHTVRAALRQLAAERLVSIQPYSGARVTLLDDNDIRALMQLRSALEGEAVRLLNRRARATPAAADAASASTSGGSSSTVSSSSTEPGPTRTDARRQPPSISAGGTDALHLPPGILAANARLRRTCLDAPDDRGAIESAHAALHHAIVEAAGSPRITHAHAQLEAETILFLAQLRRVLDADEMIRQHDQLVADLLVRGEDAIHEHLELAADQLITARAAG
ncbi:GntR family transcriptional regulator [Subtercola sp. YIM 133946]|uniref:GntR family transcriptional regulator n=1 Tax=Subtercola sp. YIM 133946 TaxID=3118909 RepID=UPI002F958B79